MRLDEQVTITCTDTDKSEKAKVVRLGRDRVDVMVGQTVISLRQTKPGLYVGSLHGMEFVLKSR